MCLLGDLAWVMLCVVCKWFGFTDFVVFGILIVVVCDCGAELGDLFWWEFWGFW